MHSIDAFILRELVRRCNHHGLNIKGINDWLTAALLERGNQLPGVDYDLLDGEHRYFIEQYERSGQPTAAILPWLNASNVHDLPIGLLHDLKRITNDMLKYKAFPVVTIHDSFASHANNCNWVRHWYKEILAELADSDILSDIMSQLHQSPGKYEKLSPDLSKYIRQSQYALS